MLFLKSAVTMDAFLMNVYSMPSAFTEALRELNVPFALRDGCKSNSGVQVHVNLKDALNVVPYNLRYAATVPAREPMHGLANRQLRSEPRITPTVVSPWMQSTVCSGYTAPLVRLRLTST
jgi:hypothetical protein